MIKIYFDGNIPNHILYIIEYFNYTLTSLNDCDFIFSCKFYAETTNNIKIIQQNLNSYLNINKKVIVFLICDFSNILNIPNNVLLFRTSLYKTKKRYNEFLLPYIWECFLDKQFNNTNIYINSNISTSNDTNINELPIVGFCGRVDKYREGLINALQNDKYIKKNFILKKDFWGGDPHNSNLIDNFIKNIQESHFTICNRGNGNYSMRFYQTLSLGRIPVLIDTDLIFPFEDKIDWNEIIIIGQNETDVINKIKYWWKTKNINEIQLKCKKTFDIYFNHKTFLNNLFNDFYNTNNTNNNFMFPIDFDVIIYGKYNDLENLSNDNLIKHYIEHGKNEKRVYKLPDNFNVNSYKKMNLDLIHLNDNDLIKHYVNYGINENRNF
jgi:hypothetical protein